MLPFGGPGAGPPPRAVLPLPTGPARAEGPGPGPGQSPVRRWLWLSSLPSPGKQDFRFRSEVCSGTANACRTFKLE